MHKNRAFLVTLITAAAAALALMAFAATAAATIVTAPAGTAYTGTLKAESEGSVAFWTWEEVACESSTIEAKIESHGSSVTATGSISDLSFTGCGESKVTVLKKGSLQIHPTSNGNGMVTWSGGEITIEMATIFGPMHCVYGTFGYLGDLTAAPSSTGHAKLDVYEGVLGTLAGNPVICFSTTAVAGTYKFTTPTGLRVD